MGEADPSFEGFHGSGYVLPSDMSNDLTVAVDTSLIRNVTTASNNLRLLGLTAVRIMKRLKMPDFVPNEYTFNSKLGFISLNTTLTSDQVLAVAFQYQVIGDDAVYQVGSSPTRFLHQSN